MNDNKASQLNSDTLTSLYSKEPGDLVITPLQDKYPGFTLVRGYEQHTQYHKEGMKMFIRLYVMEDYVVCGGVEMVKDSDTEGMYTLVSGEQFKQRVTSFSFGKEEGVRFDNVTKQIDVSGRKKSYTLNSFIGELTKNHLEDRLRWNRLYKALIKKVLQSLFWLSDQQYDEVLSLLRPGKLSEKHNSAQTAITEPFFNYFNVSKNILFVGVMSAVVVSATLIIFDTPFFSVLNPLVPLIAFLSLFILEKCSMKLKSSIDSFYNEEKNNTIYGLHDKLWRSGFKLKYWN